MSIYLGNEKIKELYFGSTKLKELYLGGIKIFSSGLTFVVNLNNQWVEATEYDFSADGYKVFKSNSNYHVASSTASMFIQDIENKSYPLTMKYYSSSEGKFDRIYIDTSPDGTNYANVVTQNGIDNSSAPGTLSNYYTKTFSQSDLSSIVKFRFRYVKDNSVNKALDRAFVALPIKSIRSII